MIIALRRPTKVRAPAVFRVPAPLDEELAFVLLLAVEDAVGFADVTESEGVEELVWDE